jgi:hypothetical protein
MTHADPPRRSGEGAVRPPSAAGRREVGAGPARAEQSPARRAAPPPGGGARPRTAASERAGPVRDRPRQAAPGPAGVPLLGTALSKNGTGAYERARAQHFFSGERARRSGTVVVCENGRPCAEVGQLPRPAHGSRRRLPGPYPFSRRSRKRLFRARARNTGFTARRPDGKGTPLSLSPQWSRPDHRHNDFPPPRPDPSRGSGTGLANRGSDKWLTGESGHGFGGTRRGETRGPSSCLPAILIFPSSLRPGLPLQNIQGVPER